MKTLEKVLLGVLAGTVILIGLFFIYDYSRNQNIGYLERRVLSASHNIYNNANAKDMTVLSEDVKTLLSTTEKLRAKIDSERAGAEAKLEAATGESEISSLNAYLQTLNDLQRYNEDIYTVAGTGGQLDFSKTDDPRINIWLDLVAASFNQYGLGQPIATY